MYNDNNIENNSHKMYYVVGVIILLVVGGWYVFTLDFSAELTEEKCLEMFSLYEPDILNAEIVYDDTGTYVGDGYRLSVSLNDDGIRCELKAFGSNVKKGSFVECGNGLEIYLYKQEHDEFYEFEYSYDNFTLSHLFYKNNNTEYEFNMITDELICGGDAQ